MYQNEHIVGFGIIFWSALSWIYLDLIGIFVIYSPDFIHSWLWLTLMALTRSLSSISLTRVSAIHCLVGEEKCKAPGPKYPWLGRIGSCDLLAGC